MVVDTTVVVSALLFEHGRLCWIRESWTRGTLKPLVSRDTVSELLRVLAYPKFQLTTEEIDVVLSSYLPFVETVEIEGPTDDLPRCSDPDDQKFLELAHSGRAEALVTGDRALLALEGKTTFEILKPAALERMLSL